MSRSKINKSMDQFKNACRYVSKLLAQYPRTVKEIEDKLLNKGYNKELIKKTIAFFVENKLLSDKDYALAFLESQIKNRPVGRILLYKKMIKRGLSKELVKKVIADYFTSDLEQETAYKLAREKERKLPRDITRKNKFNKIGRYLQSKGFTEDIIWQVLEKLNLLN